MKIIILILLICLAAGLIAYNTYGRIFIKTVYEGGSLKIINEIIKGQANNPLQFYFDKADKLTFKFTVVLLLTALLLFLYSIKFKITAFIFFILVLSAIGISFSYKLDMAGGHPDSTNYISCAEHLRAGKGFYSTGWDHVAYDELRRTGIMKKGNWLGTLRPYVYWGPLYPFLLAILMRLLNTDALVSAFFIHLFSLSIIITITYLTLAQPDHKGLKLYAAVFSVLLISFHPFELMFFPVETEMVYTALSICLVFLMQKFYTCPSEKEFVLILLSVIVTSLALLCRYVGLVLLITGVIVILYKNGFAITKKKIINCLVFSVASALPFLLWLIRSKILVGSLLGGYRGPFFKKNIFYTSSATIKIMSKELLFTDNNYIIWIGLTSLLCLAIYKRKGLKLIVNKYFAFVLYPFLYLLSLVVSESILNLDDMGRYLMPVYPFIIIAAFLAFISYLYSAKNLVSSIFVKLSRTYLRIS